MTQEMTEEAYLDCETSASPSAWKVAVEVGTRSSIFKLDAGAEVTTFSKELFLDAWETIAEAI